MIEPQRMRSMMLEPGSTIDLLSVKAMIAADCVGQYARGTEADRLNQARAPFALFPHLDRAYLERRFRYESAGDHGLEILTP